ncbi:MAG: D-2-hydroxyacid dehydrogenase [Zetaproteobacteria bacterium]|nr:MAG: D-2-hydroxyacid dehydrogenase [Zetaproteobacteria bacterium]
MLGDKLINVLVSARVTREQLDRMKSVHPRLVIHGEPGGIAIMTAEEAAAHRIIITGIDYPVFRPDVDYKRLLAEADVLLATRIPPNVTELAPRLRWIQFTSAGVDHLWNPTLRQAKIIVTSTRGIHVIPLSEFTMSCILMFAKGWPRLIRQQQEHQWSKFLTEELHGKTLVCIGVGEIGKQVARLARAFGMHVIGVRRRDDIRELPSDIDEIYPASTLRQVLPRGDYVVACLPLTAKTRGCIGEEDFRTMKPSALFVNVGRGKTVDEAAMVRCLREGWIQGAALDVFAEEPLPKDNPLWDLPNVLICPHMGTDTALYAERITEIVCDNMKRYAEGKPLRNVIDQDEGY